MQKKILGIVILILCMLMSGCGNKDEKTPNTSVYYIDSELLMLIGVPSYCEGESSQEMAENMLEKLRIGQDFNRKIKRQIPDIKNGMTVSVNEKTAVVNLSSEFVEKHSEGRIAEKLTVYQIVNSLTSIDGIDYVRFTINSEECKCFKGFIDMREIFSHKDYVL